MKLKWVKFLKIHKYFEEKVTFKKIADAIAI